jgi:prepilin signal peptidase PulO-like enzyme (type II secretory pathway)
MYRSELTYFIVLSLIIILTPLLPTSLLLLLDLVIVRIGVVLLLLYLISMGPTAGIFGLMAICVIYLERNRRKVDLAKKKLDKMDFTKSRPATVEEASTPQKTVPVRSFDQPDNNETDFLPIEEPCDITMFEPVAPSINEKTVLSTVYPLGNNESGSGSNDLYEKLGFGHINGVETMGDADHI